MKRHSRAEVVAKLRQAEELARRGQPQATICKALGISVMTYHRWRKELDELPDASVTAEPKNNRIITSANGIMTQAQVEELQVENRRLRKIVTDLLLEKSKIEEALTRRKIRA